MIRGLLAAALSALLGSVAAAQPQADPQLLDARRLFESAEYERALPLLNQAVSTLEGTGEQGRSALVEALQLRGRVQFTLGNEPAATEDFVKAVTLDPASVLPAEVSPRILKLFDSVRLARVGKVVLAVNPSDAVLQLDGRPAAASSPIALAIGEHVIEAARAGYTTYSAKVQVLGGSDQVVTIALVRVSATLAIVTSPPDVEVVVNGTVRGATQQGPLAPEYANLPGRLAVAASEIARPFVLTDLTPATYAVQLRKPCYQTELRSVPIDAARDYRLEPVALKPATSTLRVESSDPEAVVFLDDKPLGPAPLDLRTLCEGDHLIELRSPAGRYHERVTAVRGGALKVAGAIKPAFAIVSVAGLPSGYRGEDLRLDVERLLRSTRTVTLIAPPIGLLKPVLSTEGVVDDSLAFDLTRRPLGAAARMTAPVRRDVVRRLADTLQVQGLASIAVIGGETAVQRLAVSLFASGGSEPDVVLVDLQDTAQTLRAIDALDTSAPLSVQSLGMLVIDVADAAGVVVARVDRGGPADAAGVKPGERLVEIASERTTNESVLARVLEEHRTDDNLPATVADRAGATRQVSLKPVHAPRLASVFDQTLPFNALAIQWRNRMRTKIPGDDGAMVGLNLAVASIRIGDFDSARNALNAIQLGSGTGISRGTVDFLLGLACKGLGDIGGARDAWTRAAAAEGAILSDYGGRVADLARQQLQTLLAP